MADFCRLSCTKTKLDQWEKIVWTQQMKLTWSSHNRHLKSNKFQECKCDVDLLLFFYKRLCTVNFGICDMIMIWYDNKMVANQVICVSVIYVPACKAHLKI